MPEHAHLTRRTFFGRLALGAAALTVARLLPGNLAAAQGAAWPAGMALDVSFSVATQATGRVRRPYVAVWIENAQGQSVRTLAAWHSQDHYNPRWVQELRRWFRQNSDLDATVSSATRNPGSYTLSWDGKDDRGRALPQGSYTVNVESAREHGPYSLVSAPVVVGAAPFRKVLGSDNDIEAASVSYGKA